MSEPGQLARQIDAGTAPTILDVRSEAEFKSGHVPGAIHIPFWQISRHIDRLPARHDEEIVVYCGHGPRAYMAGAALRRLGFSRVTYLNGHMHKWKSLKLPLAMLLLMAVLRVPAATVCAQTAEAQMVSVEGEGAQYWPSWRGPSGQGLAAGSFPDRWSATDGVAWKTAIPGRGNSSPVVWGESVFLTTAYDSGRRLSLLAFNRADGRKLWEAFAPDGRAEYVHQKNGHASATPATDGKLIYVSFGSRGLVAFTLDGKVAWHQDLGPLQNYHGAAGSPLLYKDRIILFQDHYGGGFVAAFDTRSGKPIWRTRRSGSIGWGTPIAVRVGEHDEIIVSSQSSVTGYDPDTGKELWRCDGNSYEVIPTPVVGKGLIFAASGRVGPTLAIRPGGHGDVTRSHLVWSSPRGAPFVPSPLLYGDYLYTVNDMASIVTCFEAATGKVMWQGRLGIAQREGFSASPVGVDGKVFFTNDEGDTFVLRAGPKFELLHTNSIGETTLASPALVEGRWYIRTSQYLYAIGG